MKIREAYEAGRERFPRQLFDGWFHADGAGREVAFKYATTPCASVLGQCMAGIPELIDLERVDELGNLWMLAHQCFPLLSMDSRVAVTWAMLRGGIGRRSYTHNDPDYFHNHYPTIGDAALALNDEWRITSDDIVEWMSHNESEYAYFDSVEERACYERKIVTVHERMESDEDSLEYIRSVMALEVEETRIIEEHRHKVSVHEESVRRARKTSSSIIGNKLLPLTDRGGK